MARLMTNHDEEIDLRAAHWVLRLTADDMDESEQQEFRLWLSGDPRHERAFVAHSETWHSLDDLCPSSRARLVTGIVPCEERFTGWRKRIGVQRIAATLILGALVLCGWAFVNRLDSRPVIYATQTGEMRTIALSDGSAAYLNTRTRLEWSEDGSERRVALLEGEALFDVAHDASRPFRVRVGDGEIRVLGTRFNVYRKRSGAVIVTVLDGSVEVSDLSGSSEKPAWQRQLTANQQVVYRSLGVVQDIRKVDAQRLIRWRDGVLVMDDEPLSEVLDELTRYTDYRLLIRDPRLIDFRVAGAITVRSVHEALAGLKAIAPVEVSQSGNTISVDFRSNAPPAGNAGPVQP